MEFFAEYGLFLAKLLTVLIVLLFFLAGVCAVIMLVIMRVKAVDVPLRVKSLNHKYEKMNLTLKSIIQPRKVFKQTLKEHRAKQKRKTKQYTPKDQRKNIYVLTFKGDIRATGVASLREEITAVQTVAAKGDEVVVLLESSGGLVHDYGLAASQLRRLREKGIRLTVAVDKVAASGGYLMACVADYIIAAPFAVIGSVGVLGQLPNFNRFLKKHAIDFEQIAAGEYKRTLSLFGENTEKGKALFREQVEETHQLFKNFIRENRPQVDIERIATGKHWYGTRALDLKLVDALQTSDDYLCALAEQADLYDIDYGHKPPFIARIFSLGSARQAFR